MLLGAVVTPTRRSSNTRSSVILPTRCGLCKRDIPGSRVVMGRERHFAFLHLFPRSSPHNGFLLLLFAFGVFPNRGEIYTHVDALVVRYPTCPQSLSLRAVRCADYGLCAGVP